MNDDKSNSTFKETKVKTDEGCTITVNFSDEEITLIKLYAKKHNMTIEEFCIKAVHEKVKNKFMLSK